MSLPLEALRYDVTPVGLHYTLSHFDIPAIDAASFRLKIAHRDFPLAELQSLPQRTVRVTLECAGNGRAGFTPRYPSMPWTHGGVGTAEWTGVPLRAVL
ncbi:MAG: molybdopterin-dependent oxidoreductase, partial [Xanthobacteraceae bacterium]